MFDTPQLAPPQRVEQGGQHLGIMDIFQRDFRRHDIVGHRLYCQMQLAPDSPPCFLIFYSPSANTFNPVESITKTVMRVVDKSPSPCVLTC